MTLDPAQDIDTAVTDSPPEALRAARVLGGWPHASAKGTSFTADRISTRLVVSTATIGAAAGEPT